MAAHADRQVARAAMTTALLFLASLTLVVVASELFTNAIEWAGYLLNLGTGATGSLLAALGTSLPETVVPIVALATHSPAADSVATGAVLGSPFLLLTLGAGATGIAVMLRGGARRLVIDPRQARRDLGVFLGAFTVAVVSSAFPSGVRIVVGALLLLTYAVYVVATLRGSAAAGASPELLHIVRWRPGEPHAILVTLQLVIAVGLLVVGSQLFVTALDQTASALQVPALVLALVIVPVATELPETLNSVLWVRSNDDMLAFGNVAGSATFQSCVLAAIGVVFTTWHPGSAGLISATLTVLTAALLLALLWNGRARGSWLMLAIVPWLAYVVAQVATGGRLAL
ncbi:MAG: sodium:calcium antiporter [Candidatus Dormibacteria bacterium]